MNNRKLYQQVMDKWGTDAQLTKVIEELSELTKEICKAKLYIGLTENIAEEVADVEIMCEQLRFIYNFDDSVEQWKQHKLKRLAERVQQ